MDLPASADKDAQSGFWMKIEEDLQPSSILTYRVRSRLDLQGQERSA